MVKWAAHSKTRFPSMKKPPDSDKERTVSFPRSFAQTEPHPLSAYPPCPGRQVGVRKSSHLEMWSALCHGDAVCAISKSAQSSRDVDTENAKPAGKGGLAIVSLPSNESGSPSKGLISFPARAFPRRPCRDEAPRAPSPNRRRSGSFRARPRAYDPRQGLNRSTCARTAAYRFHP